MSAQGPSLDPAFLERLQATGELMHRLKAAYQGQPHEVINDALLSLYLHEVQKCPACCAAATQVLPALVAQIAERGQTAATPSHPLH